MKHGWSHRECHGIPVQAARGTAVPADVALAQVLDRRRLLDEPLDLLRHVQHLVGLEVAACRARTKKAASDAPPSERAVRPPPRRRRSMRTGELVGDAVDDHDGARVLRVGLVGHILLCRIRKSCDRTHREGRQHDADAPGRCHGRHAYRWPPRFRSCAASGHGPSSCRRPGRRRPSLVTGKAHTQQAAHCVSATAHRLTSVPPGARVPPCSRRADPLLAVSKAGRRRQPTQFRRIR